MTIDRVVKLRVQLDLFEEKLATGNWTDIDRRTYGALHNAFRLALRELKPANRTSKVDLASYLETVRGGNGEADTTASLPSPRSRLKRPRSPIPKV